MSSCWTCECGYKNCDTDECLNPKCIKKAQHKKVLNDRLNHLTQKTTMDRHESDPSDSDYKSSINYDR